MPPLRIAILGLHHDHVWGNLEELSRESDATIVAAADPHEPLREQFASLYAVPTYADAVALFENEKDLDAVYIFASNRMSEDLAVMACERGLHCLIEKPMAATLAGADRMLEAARANKVRLMVNWPFAWWPQLIEAIRRAAEGEIGTLWQVRYRAAHQGPRELGCSEYFCEWLYDPALNGAGALMDYCCYGAVLSQVVLGTPTRVTGVKLRALKDAEELPAEDNAILILQYPNALATTEASWTQIDKLTAYSATIYGSTGTFHIEPDHGGRLMQATLETPEGIALDVPEPPADASNASRHFIHLIQNPEAKILPLCDPDQSRAAQAILDAGLRAANEGRAVEL